MHVDGNEDQVSDHQEVLLVAVDLADVQLLEDVHNALRNRGQREIRLDWDVGQDFILQIGKLGPARFCFVLGKPFLQNRPVWFNALNLHTVIVPNRETGPGTILFLSPENLVFRTVPFALDLGGVHLLDDVRNTLCLWSRREKRIDRDVGPDFILQNGKLGTARPCFRLEKPRRKSGLGLTLSIFTR